MADDVRWPNDWEGGWVVGKDAVRDYWERQWRGIDPAVNPIAIDGTVVADHEVVHIYRFSGDLIAAMEIEE